MTVELISAEQVADLPDGPLGFLGFERICREALDSYLDDIPARMTSEAFRASYISSVAMAANEYGVDPDGILETHKFRDSFNGDVRTDYEGFDVAVRGIVTRVQIQTARTKRAGQLTLSQTDQTKIEHYIQLLRERIAAAPSFSDAKRKLLNKKLDELLANLRGPKVDLARTMIIVGGFFAALSQSEATIIKLPETIGSIAKLVTMAKEFQDSLFPLPPEPKQIAHQREKAAARGAQETLSGDLDDEIPF